MLHDPWLSPIILTISLRLIVILWNNMRADIYHVVTK